MTPERVQFLRAAGRVGRARPGDREQAERLLNDAVAGYLRHPP